MGVDPTESSLTTRELVFQFLVDYKREHDGNTPATREIAEGCCLSASTVLYHLTRLEIDNRIHVLNQRPRTIEIVGGAWEWSRSSEPPSGQDSQQTVEHSGEQPARQRGT